MENDITVLKQMIEEGMEALEQLEESDNRSKFKVWIEKYPEIDEKLEEIRSESGS